jgi:hydroxymethylglutaryl-CoA synthase
MIGIVGFGAYVPRSRLRRSAIQAANAWANTGVRTKGERAYAAWDEDAVTMAVEAGRDALADLPRSDIAAIILASTSAPFADRLNAGLVGAALGVREDVVAFDVSGSMRAGASAIISGAALAAAGGQVLVTAAERRGAKPGSAAEQGNADAAGAVLLGSEHVVARLAATYSLTRDFVDHFRSTGAGHDYVWEERWIREEGYLKLIPPAFTAALEKAGWAGGEITRLILPSPLANVAQAVAKALRVDPAAVADGLGDRVGYAGAAHALLMLAHTLETAKAGDRIAVVGFGNGCDVLLFEVTEEIADYRPRRGAAAWIAAGLADDAYTRFLSVNGQVAMNWGPRGEFGNKYALTVEHRYGKDMMAFIGGRDRQTGAIQFPKTPRGVSPEARGLADYDDVPMADVAAEVVSFTADWLTFHPSPPFYFGLVQFANGARVPMEFVDVAGRELVVGTSVEMTFRIKEIDRVRDYRHYFWKAAPIGSASALAEAAE